MTINISMELRATPMKSVFNYGHHHGFIVLLESFSTKTHLCLHLSKRRCEIFFLVFLSCNWFGLKKSRNSQHTFFFVPCFISSIFVQVDQKKEKQREQTADCTDAMTRCAYRQYFNIFQAAQTFDFIYYYITVISAANTLTYVLSLISITVYTQLIRVWCKLLLFCCDVKFEQIVRLVASFYYECCAKKSLNCWND